MSELTTQSCEACRADAPKVTDDEARTLLAQIPQWQIEARGGIATLVRRYRFANFVEALAFTNSVGALAETENHHPDLLTRWGEVEVSWWTHKIRGLHRNDFICAARCDVLYNKTQ